MKRTKKNYEQYLNQLGIDLDLASRPGVFHWVRGLWVNPDTYGTQLRKYDPIAFELGFKEWSMENGN